MLLLPVRLLELVNDRTAHGLNGALQITGPAAFAREVAESLDRDDDGLEKRRQFHHG